MRMQSKKDDLTEMSAVHMCDDVKKQAKHLSHVRLKARRKLICVFGGKVGFVADRALCVGHHVVDILWRRTAILLAFLIVPQVGPKRRRFLLFYENCYANEETYFEPGAVISGQPFVVQC